MSSYFSGVAASMNLEPVSGLNLTPEAEMALRFGALSGEDQRLAGEMGQKPEHPGKQDAKSDIANQLMHESKLPFTANYWQARRA